MKPKPSIIYILQNTSSKPFLTKEVGFHNKTIKPKLIPKQNENKNPNTYFKPMTSIK